MFQDVQAMSLTCTMEGLEIHQASAQLIGRITQETKFDKESNFRFFQINTSGAISYVVASTMATHMDTAEYFEPGHFDY